MVFKYAGLFFCILFFSLVLVCVLFFMSKGLGVVIFESVDGMLFEMECLVVVLLVWGGSVGFGVGVWWVWVEVFGVGWK